MINTICSESALINEFVKFWHRKFDDEFFICIRKNMKKRLLLFPNHFSTRDRRRKVKVIEKTSENFT